MGHHGAAADQRLDARLRATVGSGTGVARRGAMAEKRTGARAALPDGSVLVMGGVQATYGPSYVDPSILTSATRASSPVPRSGRLPQVGGGR